MYIGIDVGGTNLVAGLVDQEGTILHKSACPVNRSWSAEELVSQLAQLSVCAAQEGGVSLEDVEGAGAGIPGLVDNEAGTVVKTPNMPFRDTPFRELFQREEDAFLPANGEELTPLQAFTMEESPGGLLTVTSRGADGRDHTLHIQRRLA